jgi:hypothetical protein
MSTAKPTKADQIRERQARIAASKKPAATPAATAEPHPAAVPAAAAVVTKDVRSTVDVPANHHAAFKAWCAEIAPQIGRARVTTQDVLRYVVTRIVTDGQYADQLREELRRDYARRQR